MLILTICYSYLPSLSLAGSKGPPHQMSASATAPTPTMRTANDNIPRTSCDRHHLELSNDAKITEIGRTRIEGVPSAGGGP